MNKVENICINGVVFYIEDDAYESLTRYLDTLKKYFTSQPDGLEVIGDIEARIAELFAEKCKGANVVICLMDVQEVEATLGAPEDIANVDADASGSGAPFAASASENPPSLPPVFPHIPKKFFRDPDRRFLGGVCAGLSEWWGIPVWLIRLLWIGFPFISVPVLWNVFHVFPPVTIFLMTVSYFVLWIVIPKANTPARRLAMLGLPVTIEGLRNLREQTPDFDRHVYRVAAKGRNWLSETVARVFGAVFLLSGVAVFILSLLTLLFQSFLFESDWKWAYYPFSRLLPDMFNPTVVSLWMILLGLSIMIPVFLLISLGIKLLFQKMNLSPMVWGTLVGCWFLVMVSGALLSVKQTTHYAFDERSSEDSSFALPVGRDTLLIKVKAGAKYPNNPLGAFYNEGQNVYLGMPRVYVESSSSDKWEVRVCKLANGGSRLEALDRTEQMSYSFQQKDGLLILDPYFSVSPADKWALQRVTLTVRVPKGKYLHMDPSLQFYYGHYDGYNYWEHRDRGSKGLVLSTNEEGILINPDDEK